MIRLTALSRSRLTSTSSWTLSTSAGNYGKAVEVGRAKKSQSKDDLRKSREDLRRSRETLNEEGQSLLDSEDELEKMEALNPEPEIRSVSGAMRPEPTEYDR